MRSFPLVTFSSSGANLLTTTTTTTTPPLQTPHTPSLLPPKPINKMEEKETTLSTSPENTASGSPTPISFPRTGGATDPPPSSLDNLITRLSHMTSKRRGRPRKYDADGNLSYAYAAAAARKAAKAAANAVDAQAGFGLSEEAETMGTDSTTLNELGGFKKGCGRGSVGDNWEEFVPCPSLGAILAQTAGADFTPHVITVQTGEDVAAKIHDLGHKVPRGICVLSAIGTISNVTIRQPGSSGSLLTYEGQFEILSLSGSYTVSEAGGIKSRNGGLSITLASPDGHVVGGSVAGWIIAADPIQVVAGSFIPNDYKLQKRKHNRESPTTAEMPNLQPMLHYHETGPPSVSPVPAHNRSEADDIIGSGHNYNVVSSHDMQEWNYRSEPHRPYPDINVSVHGV